MTLIRAFYFAVVAPFHALSRNMDTMRLSHWRNIESQELLSLSDMELKRRGLSRDALVSHLFQGQIYA